MTDCSVSLFWYLLSCFLCCSSCSSSSSSSSGLTSSMIWSPPPSFAFPHFLLPPPGPPCWVPCYCRLSSWTIASFLLCSQVCRIAISRLLSQGSVKLALSDIHTHCICMFHWKPTQERSRLLPRRRRRWSTGWERRRQGSQHRRQPRR